MKEYEAFECSRRFLPMLPIYARLDGRGFSRFTHDFDRPYERRMSIAMVETAKALVEATHARIGYTQSDEISLVWLADDYNSEVFFASKIMKMTSVLAGLATASFMWQFHHLADRCPHFDCRVIQLPNQTEAANMFLWRELDATKNAISMAARSVYSHKQLDHKNSSEMQEMLFQKGINFNDYPSFFKRGTFVRRTTIVREFTPEELTLIPESHRPSPGTTFARSHIVELDMPKFNTVDNREAVIFDRAEPILKGDGVEP